MDQDQVIRELAIARVQGMQVEALRQAAALQCHRELLRAAMVDVQAGIRQQVLDGEQLARNAVALADGLMRALGLGR